MYLWGMFIAIYPVALWGLVQVEKQNTVLKKVLFLYVGLSQYTIGFFGIFVLLFWWGAHRKKNAGDILSFFGYLLLGLLMTFLTMILFRPFLG